MSPSLETGGRREERGKGRREERGKGRREERGGGKGYKRKKDTRMYDSRVTVAVVCNTPARYLDMHCLFRILTAKHFPWLMKVITASSNVANKIQNNREQCMFNCEVGVKDTRRKGRRRKEKLLKRRNGERTKPN